ncbi:hypothetical protein FDK21_19315 [Cohaesibacter sp. CAU 1516]|uniref:hypothetical protein n=1 Tax=Cohaesibacter sp. CAU 1516 TaxID=2576038 RepID=UPI0010FD9814|nr:hypothetical protein [Cohaesibacter sp. CAU 1516]TLP42664.1 hypothetical protein FDK21_19315 [Cohaesibacter sp. CAU 1516]
MVEIYKSGPVLPSNATAKVYYHAPAVKARQESLEPKPISIVGLLRWVYGDQKADRVSGYQADDAVLGFANANGTFDRIEEMGVMISGSGPVGQDLDPAALAVHETVCIYAAMGQEQAMRAGALVLYARAGFEPGVLSELPALRCYDQGKCSYWAGDQRLSFIPKNIMRKPCGYDGPYIRKGQACDIAFSRDHASHANELKKWEIWACGLEEIHAMIPRLHRWALKPFELPPFVRRVQDPVESLL